MELEGRVRTVTGAGSGMGRATVGRLVDEGMRVCAPTSMRDAVPSGRRRDRCAGRHVRRVRPRAGRCGLRSVCRALRQPRPRPLERRRAIRWKRRHRRSRRCPVPPVGGGEPRWCRLRRPGGRAGDAGSSGAGDGADRRHRLDRRHRPVPPRCHLHDRQAGRHRPDPGHRPEPRPRGHRRPRHLPGHDRDRDDQRVGEGASSARPALPCSRRRRSPPPSCMRGHGAARGHRVRAGSANPGEAPFAFEFNEVGGPDTVLNVPVTAKQS